MSNATKLNPVVEIEIGEKKVRVKFGIRAFRRLEEVTGKSLFSGEMFDDIGLNDVVLLLWAGMLHEKPKLEIDEIDELFELHELTAISSQLMEALQTAFKLASPEPKKNAEAAQDAATTEATPDPTAESTAKAA